MSIFGQFVDAILIVKVALYYWNVDSSFLQKIYAFLKISISDLSLKNVQQ